MTEIFKRFDYLEIEFYEITCDDKGRQISSFFYSPEEKARFPMLYMCTSCRTNMDLPEGVEQTCPNCGLKTTRKDGYLYVRIEVPDDDPT